MIGASAGDLETLGHLTAQLQRDFLVPIFVCLLDDGTSSMTAIKRCIDYCPAEA